MQIDKQTELEIHLLTTFGLVVAIYFIARGTNSRLFSCRVEYFIRKSRLHNNAYKKAITSHPVGYFYFCKAQNNYTSKGFLKRLQIGMFKIHWCVNMISAALPNICASF